MHTFTVEQAAQHFVLREEFPQRHMELRQKIAQLWQTDTCDVLSCGHCGLKFSWPFVAGDGRFYNLAYPFSAYPKDRWEFRVTINALRRMEPLTGLAMEIGSGFGHFLTQLSPAFVPPSRVIAIEYNEFARGKLAGAGFTAIGEDVRSSTFDSYERKIGAFFLFQVLEHLDDLDGLLSRFRRLAQDGASLFMAVPNAQRIDFNEAHGALYDMPPNHISQWPRRAFEALAQRTGLQLVEHKTEPMAMTQFVKQDAVSAHMRRAQNHGSVANILRGRPRTGTRVALEGLLALVSLPTRVPVWAAAKSSAAALGDSDWVHFRLGHAR